MATYSQQPQPSGAQRNILFAPFDGRQMQAFTPPPDGAGNWWDDAVIVQPAPSQDQDQWWADSPIVEPAPHGPWERYQMQKPADGPWTRYQNKAAAEQSPAATQVPSTGEAAPIYDALGNVTGYEAPALAVPSMGYDEQMGNAAAFSARSLDNAARLVANGATFGLADKAAGGMDALTGQAGSYDEGVRAQLEATQAIRDANPVAAGTVEAAGGLLGGAAMIRNGVTLAGRMGTGMFPRIAGFGAEGAAYGAAHGAGNTYSDDPQAYAAAAYDSGKWGAGVGVALPIGGSAVSGLSKVGAALFGGGIANAGRRVNTLLNAAAQADEAGLRALPARGDEAMLVDAGPSFLGLGQGVGTSTGAGRSVLETALRTRDEGTGPRLAAAVESAIGPAAVPSQVDAGIRASQRALSPAYQDAFTSARPVDTRSIADSLESSILTERGSAQTAARDVRRMLDVTGEDTLDTNPRTLFAVRNEIDAMMEGATGNARRILGDTRRSVDAALADAVPGIKQADAQFAELARQREALERGQTIFDTGRGTVVRPAELEAELAGMSPGQRDMHRTGARAEVDRLVGTNVNDLATLERTLATPQDWNRQKMTAEFGGEATEAIARALTDNRVFRDSYQRIVQGSQTAQRNAAAAALDAGINVPSDLTMTGIAGKGIQAIARALTRNGSESLKEELGQILAQRGPEAQRLFQRLLDQATNANERADLIRRVVANPALLGGASSGYSNRR